MVPMNLIYGDLYDIFFSKIAFSKEPLKDHFIKKKDKTMLALHCTVEISRFMCIILDKMFTNCQVYL